jgi:hypothetical protein
MLKVYTEADLLFINLADGFHIASSLLLPQIKTPFPGITEGEYSAKDTLTLAGCACADAKTDITAKKRNIYLFMFNILCMVIKKGKFFWKV